MFVHSTSDTHLSHSPCKAGSSAVSTGHSDCNEVAWPGWSKRLMIRPHSLGWNMQAREKYLQGYCRTCFTDCTTPLSYIEVVHASSMTGFLWAHCLVPEECMQCEAMESLQNTLSAISSPSVLPTALISEEGSCIFANLCINGCFQHSPVAQCFCAPAKDGLRL